MSTQLELLIALVALLAGVLYAWMAVQGCRPWRLFGGGSARAREAARRDFRDTSPGVQYREADHESKPTAQ